MVNIKCISYSLEHGGGGLKNVSTLEPWLTENDSYNIE